MATLGINAVKIGRVISIVTKANAVQPFVQKIHVHKRYVSRRTLTSCSSSKSSEGLSQSRQRQRSVRAMSAAAEASSSETKVASTMFDKIWQQHIVEESDDGTSLIYIDRHLVHEVTSPQAFEGLRTSGRTVRRPEATLATADHNVPTSDRSGFVDVQSFIKEEDSKIQVMALESNVEEFGIQYFGMADNRQGIVHIIGPEQGFTLPGMTIVCGDSHTATHGAFGALAFGIGTSEVEHVLATQTLLQRPAKNMRVSCEGDLAEGVTSKDLVLHIIGLIGTAGGTGHVIEFAGSAIRSLSMEARMTVCNMAIEGGARAGMIAPDQTTFDYLRGRPMAPLGDQFDEAVEYWRTLPSDPGSKYDKEVVIDAASIPPTITWGTSPEDTAPITDNVPNPADIEDPQVRAKVERSLSYMGLEPGQRLNGTPIEKVFIGSCTNGRIEDLRAVARVAKGRQVAKGVHAMVVPGSGLVKLQAEEEGLPEIFRAAGFDWREPGCSMCLAMNPDKLEPGQRCASTSNRNFEGRQGNGGRTHLMSPQMAAAAAIMGCLTDVRDLPPVTDSSAPDSPFTFTSLTSVAAPMDLMNVDTDMIIPKQFLKTIKRTGLGSALFFEMRFDSEGNEIADFVLNQDKYRNSKILIAGDNFGCGSSREHAPWALKDFGIQCVISTSFADIFFNNSFKNGMLSIKLEKDVVRTLMEDARAGGEFNVDLPTQTITRPNGEKISFDVDQFRKHCLLNGLDDIGLTLQKGDKITEFEAAYQQKAFWLFQ
eukprot:CAMPEP_0196581418 /NCGR_PEP_ID=MMETSP1081-20130531/33943_1 /TAXON_ID=36882 /ORGANISM="Pyramimonas amylifera, Strain CCMP720" /LENGTH=763 /DNA_ID=CAMNT_0041901643 /DNA_START=64 /DNA_END=2355 /DNA_ORIENTATION=-